MCLITCWNLHKLSNLFDVYLILLRCEFVPYLQWYGIATDTWIQSNFMIIALDYLTPAVSWFFLDVSKEKVLSNLYTVPFQKQLWSLSVPDQNPSDYVVEPPLRFVGKRAFFILKPRKILDRGCVRIKITITTVGTSSSFSLLILFAFCQSNLCLYFYIYRRST